MPLLQQTIGKGPYFYSRYYRSVPSQLIYYHTRACFISKMHLCYGTRDIFCFSLYLTMLSQLQTNKFPITP